MSGGQKQRVVPAYDITTDFKLVLVEEPTGDLDYKSSKMLLEKLKKLISSSSFLFILVCPRTLKVI